MDSKSSQPYRTVHLILRTLRCHLPAILVVDLGNNYFSCIVSIMRKMKCLMGKGTVSQDLYTSPICFHRAKSHALLGVNVEIAELESTSAHE